MILLRMLQRRSCDIGRPMVVSHGEHRNPDLLSVHLQLPNCSRTVHIQRGEQRLLSLFGHFGGDLCCSRRFAGALKTAHHDDRDRLPGLKGNFSHLGAHQLCQLLVDNFDDLLSRIEAAHDLASDGPLLDAADELLYDTEIDIRLQQRHLHFPESRPHIRLRQLALATQTAENMIQFF